MAIHAQLSAGRWATLSLAEQLGNIGGELERSLSARDKGLSDRFQRTFDRMLELFDMTLADPRWRGRRLREIARARESVCAAFYGDVDASNSVDGLRR